MSVTVQPKEGTAARMQPRRALVVAGRIVRQVLGDRRTLALLVVVPVLVILLVGYLLRTTSSSMTLAVDAPFAVRLDRLAGPSGVSVIAAPAGADQQLQDGKIDGILRLQGNS